MISLRHVVNVQKKGFVLSVLNGFYSLKLNQHFCSVTCDPFTAKIYDFITNSQLGEYIVGLSLPSVQFSSSFFGSVAPQFFIHNFYRFNCAHYDRSLTTTQFHSTIKWMTPLKPSIETENRQKSNINIRFTRVFILIYLN